MPRTSINNYLEVTVPGYSEVEFIRYFRITLQLFWNLVKSYRDSNEYQRMREKSGNTTELPGAEIFYSAGTVFL